MGEAKREQYTPEQIKAVLADLARRGLVEVVGVDKDGNPMYRATTKGLQVKEDGKP